MNKKQLQRMLELSDIKPITESKVSPSSIELLKKGSDGNVYAIIRENRKYFIKTTDKKQNLNESDFDYIGGVANKPKYSYNSYEEATKHMNLMFDELNRLNGGKPINIFESDTHLLDEKKYVLKMDKPKAEPKQDFGGFDFGGGDSKSEKPEKGGFDFGSSDSEGEDTGFDFGNEGGDEGEDTGFDFGDEGEDTGDDEGFGDEGEDTGDEDLEFDDEELDDEGDPIKSIQKLTGKLGQKLRDTEDMSSDMQKWVAKSVLAALDLGDMDKDDKKDLIRTIKTKKAEKPEGEFGEDFNMEESYDSYMDDEMPEFDSYHEDELPLSQVDMSINDKAYLNPNFNPGYDDYDSYMDDELPLSQIDMSISDKAYLNPNFNTMYGPEDSDEWYDEMDDEGFFGGNDYIDEDEDLETRRGGERYDRDELLFDEYDSYMDDNVPFPTLNNQRYVDGELDYDYNLDINNEDSMNPRMFPSPAPSTPAPTKEPGTKPSTPGTDRPARPSRRPFNPPPHITPGEEPGPKAGEEYDSYMDFDPTMSPSPAPSKPAPTKEPATKPGKPGTDRPTTPSRRPFTPPPHITPGEEPGPKAGRRDYNSYMDDDIEFEY